MAKFIRCYAEGHGDQWEALCLDFDLAVQGRSFEEVYHDLNGSIALYLESVAELPAPERKRMLNRRAPWLLRVKFALRLGWALLFGRDGGSHGGYTMPCPA